MSKETKQPSTPESKNDTQAEQNITSAPQAAPEADGDAQPKRNKYADKMNRQKKKLSKKARIAIAAGAVVVVGAAVAFGILHSRGASQDDESANTAVATRGMLETYVEGSGTTAAKKREELGRDIKGTVAEVLVEEGDEVKEGDTLLVINPTETKKELASAEDELADAQRGVTDAVAGVTRAQNAVDAAKKKIGNLAVAAPFTGKVIPVTDADGNSTTYRVGQQLGEGDVIGYMVDDSQMKLSIYFSTAYMDEIKAGQTATVSIPSAMSAITGTVSSVESAQKVSAEGVKLFRVNITMKNAGSLTKGMLATATVATPSGEVYPAESGNLEYIREEAITIQTGGKIQTLNGLDYYSYSAGQTILTMTSDTVEDELKQAQNDVTTAQNGVTTAQKLVQTKQERIVELRKLIEDSTIKSPIAGVVVSVNAVEEQEVSGSDALVVVADLNDIIVNADVMSTDISSVQVGQFATMNMYANDGSTVTLTGTVTSVAMEPTQNQSGGQGSMATFRAVIAIDPIEGQSIYSGQGVEYQITTASVDDCLMVPSSAIVNTDSGTAVFAKPRVNEDGVEIAFDETLPIPEGTEGIPEGYQLVPVETGLADSSNTEILWGIEEGTTVYLSGPADLYADMGDGMFVG